MDLRQATAIAKQFMPRPGKPASLAVLALLAATGTVQAGDDSQPMQFSIIASGKSCPGCVVINASGQIVDETSRNFAVFLSQNRLSGVLPAEPADGQFPPSDATKVIIAFESIGGKVQPALIMGRRIRKAGWTTVIGQARLQRGQPVFNQAGCFSACTMVMLGGTARFVVPGSKVGVHQFSPQFTDGESFDAREMGQIVRDYGREVVSVYDFVKTLGVNEAFFTTTLRTPFNSLDVLPESQWIPVGVATTLLPASDEPVTTSSLLTGRGNEQPMAAVAKPSVGLKASPGIPPAGHGRWTLIQAAGLPATAEFASEQFRVALACRDSKTARLELSFKALAPLDLERMRAAAVSARSLRIAGRQIAIDSVEAAGNGEQSVAALLAAKDVRDLRRSGNLTVAVLDKAGEPVGRSEAIPTEDASKTLDDAMASCGA